MCFQIQNKQRELDALKNRNEALLLKMKEAQERYKKEEEELQVKPRPFYVERTCYIGCVTSMSFFWKVITWQLLKNPLYIV